MSQQHNDHALEGYKTGAGDFLKLLADKSAQVTINGQIFPLEEAGKLLESLELPGLPSEQQILTEVRHRVKGAVARRAVKSEGKRRDW